MKYLFCDSEIELSFSPDGMLAWPTAWEQELLAHGFLEAATTILKLLPSCAVKVPWLIGSASRNLVGEERTESRSHLEGRAFDMSPMYTKDLILSPDKQIMGLAWNIVSVCLLSSAYEKYPHFVVEGDHLHVQPGADLPVSGLLLAFTMPSWYPWVSSITACDESNPLCDSMWIFAQDEAAVRLASDSEVVEYLAALSDEKAS